MSSMIRNYLVVVAVMTPLFGYVIYEHYKKTHELMAIQDAQMAKDQCELTQIKKPNPMEGNSQYIYECKKTGITYSLGTYFKDLDKNKVSNAAFIK